MDMSAAYGAAPPRRRRAKGNTLFLTGVMIATAALITLVLGAIYLFATETPDDHQSTRSTSSFASLVSARTAKPAFTMGPVHLGMTLDEFRDAFPSAPVVEGQEGETLAMTHLNGATYTLAFMNPSTASRASVLSKGDAAPSYRITYRQSFLTMKEEDLMRRLGKRFGRPTAANCGTSLSRTADGCRYSWVREGGIEVQARILARGDQRTRVYTVLHLEATDMRLANKREQMVQDNQAEVRETGTTPQTRETLPF